MRCTSDAAPPPFDEKTLQATFENVASGVALVSLQGQLLWINSAFCHLLGYSRDELKGIHFRHLAHADHFDDAKKSYGDLAAGKVDFYNAERKFQKKDGSLAWCTLTSSLVRRPDGSPNYVIGVLEDVTKQKNMEQALRQSEERFALAMKGANDGLWDWNLETDAVYFSPRWKSILGFADHEIEHHLGEWERLIKPEQLKSAKESIDKCIKGETDFFEAEFKMRHKKGHWVDILSRGFLVKRPSDGQPIRMVGTHVDISQLKLAQKAIDEVQKKCRSLVDNANVGITVFQDGRLVFFNRAHAELCGATVKKSGEEKIFSRIHPDDRERVLKRVKAVEKDAHNGLGAQFKAITDTGKIKWLHSHSTQIEWEGKTAVLSFINDISEAKKAEKTVHESREKYRTLVHNANLGIHVFHQGQRALVNPGFIKILGYTEEKFHKLEMFSFIHPDDLPIVLQKLAEIEKESHREVITQFRVIAKTGQIKWVQAFSSNIDWEGGKAILSFINDVTEIKKADEEKASLESQLRQAQKMESLGKLAGGIAHDFNNILAAITGFAELALEGDEEGQDVSGDLREVLAAAARAKGLVRHILTFSRRVESELRPLDINREINQAADILKRTIAKMIDIELNLAGDLGYVQGDPSQLEQVLLNLGTNARDAMPGGGVISIETANVDLDQEFCRLNPGSRAGNYVRITFQDNGQGMTPQTLKKVFDPFFTTKAPGAGTGLGLATAYGIIKNHGGYITCRSQPGRGSVFTIFLPVIPPDCAEQASPPGREQALQGGSETVLLVDDERPLRAIWDKLLSKWGYKVLLAESGEQALEIYRGKPLDIDLVILDLNMPGMGGVKCMEQLLAEFPQTLILITSGHSANEKAKNIIPKGALGYIFKPFGRDELLSEVRKVLDAGKA